MCASSGAELLPAGRVGPFAWLRERVDAIRFVVLAFAIAAVGTAGAVWPGAPTFVARAALALVLVVALRLLDDLADRGRDRVRHPDRVLVRATSTRPFVLVLAGSLAAGGVALARVDPLRLAGLGLLLALLGGWYAWGTRRAWPHAAVLLAKYPAIALLVGDPAADPAPRTLALASLYVALLVYERATDPALR